MATRHTNAVAICDACLGRTRPYRALRIASPATNLTLRSSYHTTTAPYTANVSPLTQRLSRRQNTLPDFHTSKPSTRPQTSQPSRAYSNTTSPPFQPSDPALIRLSSRRLISISGPDAQKFLQGLVTANVMRNEGTPYYCAFLDARGRVLWDVFVWPWPQNGQAREEAETWGCYIEVDAAEVQGLLKHLKRHKLRSKVQLSLLPEADAEANNEGAMSVWSAFNLAQEVDMSALGPWVCDDPRFPPGTATRFLRAGTSAPDTPALSPLPARDEHHYRLYRYTHGVPEGPAEIVRESALPMEYNIELANGIDFRKGCYVGQELTIRTKHQGVVRKRVLPVRLYRKGSQISASLTVGSDVDVAFAASGEGGEGEGGFADKQPAIKAVDRETDAVKRGRPVGKLVARVGDVGLALCRLDVMVGMQGEEGGYEEGREFEVEQEGGVLGGVRVKAFLTEWLVGREREVWGRGKEKKGAGRGEEGVE